MPKNENSLLKLQEKYFACHTRGKGWNVLNAHTNNIVYPNRVFSQIGARALSESLNNRLNQCKEWEDAERNKALAALSADRQQMEANEVNDET